MRRKRNLAHVFRLSIILVPCLIAAALSIVGSALELSSIAVMPGHDTGMVAPLTPARIGVPPDLPPLAGRAPMLRVARFHVYASLCVFVLVVSCSLVYMKRSRRRVSASFRRLTGSFRAAAAERRSIDLREIDFEEFRELAEHANAMVRAMDSADAQLRASEEQLRQSRKMDAMGRLVGGIAHDFNNLLTAIMGYAEMIVTDGTLPPDSRESMKEIQSAAHRAGALTRQLLGFSRRQAPEKRPVNLNTIVTGVQKMLARIIGENVTLRTSLDPSLCPIQADPSQIEQVIINLVVNARDAVGEAGEIRIETLTPAGEAGPVARLCISDNGVGMDEEVKRHLFEPFLTTKESGKGTGFGLSIVHAIVTQSGGVIGVRSGPGEGTAFTLTFPGIAGDEYQDLRVAGDTLPRGGTETILFVEDDPVVTALAARVLVQAGYLVVSASTATQAFALMHESRDWAPHLLVTDIVLPDMTGSAMYTKLSVEARSMEVLYISGYSADEGAVQKVLDDGALFLPKPFTASALLSKVRECIDGPT